MRALVVGRRARCWTTRSTSLLLVAGLGVLRRLRSTGSSSTGSAALLYGAVAVSAVRAPTGARGRCSRSPPFPLALSLLRSGRCSFALYGDDLFRTGGSDHGRGDASSAASSSASSLWSVVLLVIGVRAVHGWTWARAAAAVALAAAFPVLVAAFATSALSAALELRELLVRHRVRVLLLGERAVAHIGGIALERVADRLRELGVSLDEARRVTLVEAEQVVPHEHLAVRAGAGADADRRDRQRLGHPRGDRRGHRLEHDREAAGGLQRERVVEQLLRLAGGAALRLEAAEHVADCGVRPMWPITGMPASTIARTRDEHRAGALELDGVGAPLLDEADRVPDRLLVGDLVRAERHVGDHERPLARRA